MNHRQIQAALALCLILWVAGGIACTSTATKRQVYLETHTDLDPQVRELIRQGTVREGMTPEQVEAALGPPDSRRRFEAEQPPVEVWTYPGVLVRNQITRTLTDLDYQVRLIFRGEVLERIEDF